jgi:hypothetical protein
MENTFAKFVQNISKLDKGTTSADRSRKLVDPKENNQEQARGNK